MAGNIAIIGAGVSGLSAAWQLRESGAAVTVFEKSRGVSGRAASRTVNGVRIDHGANYFKVENDAMEELVMRRLPTDELVEIPGAVWTFDGNNVISPGDPNLDSGKKWTYRSGISTLGKLLAEASGAEVRRKTLIERISRDGGMWDLYTNTGDVFPGFDSVLLTTPGPQAADILERSQLQSASSCLREAEYYRQFSIILAVAGEVQRRGDFHALLNADRKHRIAWLSFENDKPGHVPDGITVMVVQISPDWSAENFEIDLRDEIGNVVEDVSRLLGAELNLIWWDSQRWKFAHPHSGANHERLHEWESEGLYFAGDALVGKGRVPESIETGIEAARGIERFLNR